MAGEAPALYDVSRISNDDLRNIVPIAVLAIGLVLALVLRSLIAPLYLIASVVLSYLASSGLAVIIFIYIGGESGITFLLPFLMFIFLLALGEDYNILVMTRIREEARTRPLREAVVTGGRGHRLHRDLGRDGAGRDLRGPGVVAGGRGPGGSQVTRHRPRPGGRHPARHLRRAHRAGAVHRRSPGPVELVALGARPQLGRGAATPTPPAGDRRAAVTDTALPAAPPVLSHRRVLLIIERAPLGHAAGRPGPDHRLDRPPDHRRRPPGGAHYAWVVTAYLLASTVSTPLWGKLGDLYGRKGFFQAAIVIFLVGSALSGFSHTMAELIAFRAVQGVGGGGLMVGSQAIVGDVVSPRERGRYMGLFGAVFGLATVIGPLLGGFFVEYLSWRWVFYINLPIGVVALIVTAVQLPASGPRRHQVIDYLGTALLATAATAFVLFTSLGGTTYAWGSPVMVGLAVLGVVATACFIAVERRAAEPVLPLRLFANRVFSAASAVGFVVGFAMFGALTFLPVFFQMVKGASPTQSGLRMLPVMAGLLVASIGSGQLISRWGRYKVFPVLGTALMTVGLYLLSRVGVDTAGWLIAAVHAGAGRRARPGHAGAGGGGAERRRATGTWAWPPRGPRSSGRSAARSAPPSSGPSSPTCWCPGWPPRFPTTRCPRRWPASRPTRPS